MNFKKQNDITGWLVFLIATTVYLLTVEPTASFWDCGEFIAASYKLQVPHPPGAPLFLLIGRIFSLFAAGDVTKVAYMINLISVLSSAFSILFLFWSITMLGRKLMKIEFTEPTTGQRLTLLGAGVVGALAYTFSDSFWFSAVEAEVYAISSFFTAFVFWAILKWDRIADDENADRWLLLIAYMMGLSIGAHLLNLVTIPALAFVYYFRKYEFSWKGAIITFALSGVGVIGILNGIIPGLPSLAGSFEIFFVNKLGLPIGSGIIFFTAAFLAALVYGVIYSIKQQKVLLNTALLGLIFILIGYCSYALILVRSQFNPPIDENNPENIVSFVSYLKREQYGDRPIFFGPQYTAELIEQKQGAPVYRKKDNKYVIYDHKLVNKFDKGHEVLLPRMYSKQGGHVGEYERMVGKPEKRVTNYDGSVGYRPSFGQNLSYMFQYQLGHQYFRYFLWNFSGRDSDAQGASHLNAWDSDEGLPQSVTSNKAHNNFYMLPLILGLFGLVFQFMRDEKNFFIVFLFFILTGIALSLYLNQPPIEPRERDYIFAGSFYVFAIWIGFGIIALADLLEQFIKNSIVRPVAATLIGLSVPTIMAAKGWDDHDRSGRYLAVDSAKNLLNSCAPNAILFTGGDNDTFPLWYVQEVEGFRTDVRVCNLSLLNTDWYIEQMKQDAYESAPLPISLVYEDYLSGKNDYIPYAEKPQLKDGMFVKDYIQLVRKESPAIMMPVQSGSTITTLPTDIMKIAVDTSAVTAMNIIPAKYRRNMVSEIKWSVGKSALEKKDLIMLDMIVNGAWKRPIYFSTTLGPDNYLNLREYMVLEGLAYRLLPIKNAGAGQGVVNSDIMFENMMTDRFHYRNLDDVTVYYDENCRRFPTSDRNGFYRLAVELFNEGNKEKAKEVIDHCFKTIPDKTFPYDYLTTQFIPLMIRVGDDKKAMDIARLMVKRADEELAFAIKNGDRRSYEVRSNLQIIYFVVDGLKSEGKTAEAAQFSPILEKYMGQVNMGE